MLRGGLAGIGARGGLGSIDAAAVTPSKDWSRMLWPTDPGGTFVAQSTRVRFAGMNTASAGDVTGGIGSTGSYSDAGTGSDRYFALPEWFPIAGTIKRINSFAFRAALAVAGKFQLHVYSAGVCSAAGFVGWPYPGSLLGSGTEWTNPTATGQSLTPSSWHVYDTEMSLHVDAQTMVWFVLRCNSAHLQGSKLSLYRGLMLPWTGVTIGASSGTTDMRSMACGWYHSTTYTNGVDQTFPQTSPSLMKCGHDLTTAEIPAIGFGFAPD
jgi:hypothetical protein